MAKLFLYLGLNRAVSYGLLGRAWTILGTPVTIYLVATHLDEASQGRYYTMMSLLGLQVFFELGLATTLSHFFGHEFSSLVWCKGGRIQGAFLARARVIDLLAKSSHWFTIASFVLTLILVPLGLWFFGQDNRGSLNWELPWILAVMATSANLIMIPYISLEVGSGLVANVNRCEATSAVLGGLALWLCIISDFGLYGLGLASSIKFLIYARYFSVRRWAIFRFPRILSIKSVEINYYGVNWAEEVWPMQWRISVSWISGYFIFYLFSPIIYHYQGAAEAGRIGVTVAASTALTTISLTWINAHSPSFARLVASCNWRDLDDIFKRVFLQSTFAAFLGASFGTLLIFLIQLNFEFGARFLSYGEVALFLFASCVQVVISSLAAYLRSFKREPFFMLAVLQAILQGGATFYLGREYGSGAVAVSVFVINAFLILPVAVIIWLRCRSAWTHDLRFAVRVEN